MGEIRQQMYFFCLYFPQDTKDGGLYLMPKENTIEFGYLLLLTEIYGKKYGHGQDLLLLLRTFTDKLYQWNYIVWWSNTHYRMGLVNLWSWQYHKPL